MMNKHIKNFVLIFASTQFVKVDGFSPSASEIKSAQDMLEQEEQRVMTLKEAQKRPSWPPEATPPLMSTLHNLAEQVGKFRSDIPDFDSYLSRRKVLLRAGDESGELQPSRGLPSAPALVNEEDQDHNSSQQAGTSASLNADQSSSGPGGIVEDILLRKVTVKPVVATLASKSSDEAAMEVLQSEDPATPTDEAPPRATRNDSASVTVNHLLTNAIILQEFILELAALIQVRASLFEDVAFMS